MNEECFIEILQTLDNIRTDSDVPKNIRNKICQTISCIEEKKEDCLKANKILENLEDITNDPNVPTETRMEIMSIMSILGRMV
ncbi:UPF0147 family protein [Candidatus Woesearchaeota archaeon]|nr:UPF0147 family protein [Candidatus Woesearchaeota archaeon]